MIGNILTNQFGQYVTLANGNALPERGVLAVKHTSLIDIPLINIVLHQRGRCAKYLMKASLPFQGLLNACGGIPLLRGQEMRACLQNANDSQEKESILQWNQRAYAQASAYVNNGGLLFWAPEGHRTRGKVGPIKREGIERIVEQTAPTPICAVGIKYHWFGAMVSFGRTKCYERFGADDAYALQRELAVLSGLTVSTSSPAASSSSTSCLKEYPAPGRECRCAKSLSRPHP